MSWNKYQKDNYIDFRFIALMQYMTVCTEGSKEMTRAGTRKTVLSDGSVSEVDIPNQREIFVNGVKVFEIMMLPNLRQNKVLHDRLNQILSKMEKTSQDYKDFIKQYPKQKENASNTYEMEMVKLAQEKLVVLSDLLYHLSYLDESSAHMAPDLEM